VIAVFKFFILLIKAPQKTHWLKKTLKMWKWQWVVLINT